MTLNEYYSCKTDNQLLQRSSFQIRTTLFVVSMFLKKECIVIAIGNGNTMINYKTVISVTPSASFRLSLPN